MEKQGDYNEQTTRMEKEDVSGCNRIYLYGNHGEIDRNYWR